MESRAAARLTALLLGATLLLAGGGYWWRARSRVAPVPISSPAIRAPSGVRITVEVINETSVRGLARRATLSLRDAGFDVVRYASDTTRRDTTVVLARSGHLDWAQAVAKALGGAAVENRPDSSRYLDVTVLLGRNWRPPAQPFYP